MSHTTNMHHNLLSGVNRGTSDAVFDSDHYQSIGQIRNQTDPGEILEFQRGPYTHFALYLGDGRVMNIEIESYRASEAHIQERNLEEICHDDRVRVRNHEFVAREQFQLNPKPASKIVQDAMDYRNQVVPYEFDFRNCEYYCTLWRYGKGFSTQAARQPSAVVDSTRAQNLSGNTNASDFEEVGYAMYKQDGTKKQHKHVTYHH